MAQGRFQKKKRKLNIQFVIAVTVVIVAVCLIGTALVLDARSGENDPAQTTPGNLRPAQTNPQGTDNFTLPPLSTTEPTTEATTTPTEATTVPTTEATAPVENSLGEKVAALALEQVGTPYMHGGTSPEGFDTSGFVYYCFKENGISLPRTIDAQVARGREIKREDLLPGDVVFFWNTNEGKAEYVGIYVGGGKFVAARNPEKPTSEMDMTGPYFSQRFVTARRYG